MANLNPAKTVINVDSSQNSTRQLIEYVGHITGTGTHEMTVETKLQSILSAVVVNETDGAIVATARAASTAYPGTLKVTFTLANSKVYSYRITGFLSRTMTTLSTSGGAGDTITCNPLQAD